MELSKGFKQSLVEYDPALDAVFDSVQDSICVWAVRSGGQKILEDVWKRQTGELYPELERRCLAELKKRDVWKRFGSGKEYDDYLANKQEEYFKNEKRRYDSDRERMFKQDKDLIKAAVWNARHGRFTKETAKPYNTPTITKPDNCPV